MGNFARTIGRADSKENMVKELRVAGYVFREITRNMKPETRNVK
jgi:hypothetical protein